MRGGEERARPRSITSLLPEGTRVVRFDPARGRARAEAFAADLADLLGACIPPADASATGAAMKAAVMGDGVAPTAPIAPGGQADAASAATEGGDVVEACDGPGGAAHAAEIAHGYVDWNTVTAALASLPGVTFTSLPTGGTGEVAAVAAAGRAAVRQQPPPVWCRRDRFFRAQPLGRAQGHTRVGVTSLREAEAA